MKFSCHEPTLYQTNFLLGLSCWQSRKHARLSWA